VKNFVLLRGRQKSKFWEIYVIACKYLVYYTVFSDKKRKNSCKREDFTENLQIARKKLDVSYVI